MKRVFSVLCAVALIFSLAACSGEDAPNDTKADYSGKTLTGNVTQIEGSKVTVLLGTLNEMQRDESGQPPEIPNGQHTADGQAQPEMPDKDLPNQTGGVSAEEPSIPIGQEGQTPPEMPDDQPGKQISDERKDIFMAGEESAAFDLTGAAIKVESGAESKDGSLEDIAIDSILVIEVRDDNTVSTVTVKFMGMGGNPAGFGIGSGEVIQGTSANTLDSDDNISDTSYSSTGDDENALRIDGAIVNLEEITVEKSGGESSNTEGGDFYGVNAALLAINAANVTIKNAVINSNAKNGNGVFSYGSGTTVNISDSTITTKNDNSGGIQTTGGGTTNANNLTVDTSGNSAAAIRSDRGGGSVNVDGGIYTSNGYNSPAVYSTADIMVKNATLTANNSEALVIEGKNSITLKNCTVSGNMSDTKGTSSDENVHTVLIYQSMSGDADAGTSSFSMTGGELICNNGDVFHFTNTAATIALSDIKFTNHEEDGYFMSITGNDANHGWGTAGKNGAQVTFTAARQTMEGDIIVDTISTLKITCSDGTVFAGTVNIVNNAHNGAAVSDNAVVTIEKGCTWNLTGNCTVTSLENNGTINFNGYTITLADGSVLS